MKKFVFLTLLFAATPFLAQSEESGIKVQVPDGTFEVKTGSPTPPPNPQVIVVRPAERTTVVQPIEKTTIVQPSGGSGCSLQQN